MELKAIDAASKAANIFNSLFKWPSGSETFSFTARAGEIPTETKTIDKWFSKPELPPNGVMWFSDQIIIIENGWYNFVHFNNQYAHEDLVLGYQVVKQQNSNVGT